MIIKNRKNKIVILNVEKYSGIKKFIGLMFKKSPKKALLFEFSSPVNRKIHSFFCKPFLAVWLNINNEIVEVKLINKLGIYSPKKNFCKLLEIPLTKKYYLSIKKILKRKDLNTFVEN
ncbi:MAG: hypothetical protein QW117_02130 [Candidatus Pacearchaeota archaeon]